MTYIWKWTHSQLPDHSLTRAYKLPEQWSRAVNKSELAEVEVSDHVEAVGTSVLGQPYLIQLIKSTIVSPVSVHIDLTLNY